MHGWGNLAVGGVHDLDVLDMLARGTIAKDFEANVKAPRFVDKRG